MPRKKKKPFNRLPNGFGSIKKLSGNRRRPYGVYAPTRTVNSVFIPGEIIDYKETWEAAYERLVLYKANREWETRKKKEKLYTFSEVYQMFYREKFELSVRKYGHQTIYSTRAAFKNCTVLYDMVFADIEYQDLQNNIDSYIGKLKHSSLELIKTLYNGMYKYAIKNNICQTNYASYVEIRIPDDDEKGIPFTEDDLQKLWESDIPEAKIAFILCYSGWRIKEFEQIEIDLDNQVFQGGIKTKAGKNRIVPIHPCLIPLLEALPKRPVTSVSTYRTRLYAALATLGIDKHTPHDCRHTFSWLCDKYGVDQLAKKLMLGHSMGSDVTDAVYGHRNLEELRSEIKKLPCY